MSKNNLASSIKKIRVLFKWIVCSNCIKQVLMAILLMSKINYKEINYKMNEENRKKILIGSIIGVVTLVIAVVGATYAFFSLNVSGDTTNTNVDIETGNADVVTIEQGINAMHINLAVSDMAKDNPNKAYYATNTDDNYKLNEGDGTLTFATITGTNKEASDCTAKVTITMDTSDDSMGKALQKGDTILYIVSGETEETVDLYDLLTEELPASVTKEIEVELNVSESNSATIQGYLKVNNTGSDQSYLAGKTLNITITVNNLVCGGVKGAIAYIAENSTSGTLDTQEKLEARNAELTSVGVATENLDTLRRFVGTKTNVTDNFICFGTDDIETCKNNLDQYMYRIIGIDEVNNQVKVIKATKIVKGAKYTFQWHNFYTSNVKWEESDIYKYLNAEEVNEIENQNIFMGNPYYSYMQSDIWTNLIVSPAWYIGINDSSESKTCYMNERSSKLENGDQISLMYQSDYLYAGVSSTSNWLFIKNGLNGELNTGNPSKGVLQQPSATDEWTMVKRWNADCSGDKCQSNLVASYGYFGMNYYNVEYAVRPVFYLDGSKIMLGGEGTMDQPYIITSMPNN